MPTEFIKKLAELKDLVHLKKLNQIRVNRHRNSTKPIRFNLKSDSISIKDTSNFQCQKTKVLLDKNSKQIIVPNIRDTFLPNFSCSSPITFEENNLIIEN